MQGEHSYAQMGHRAYRTGADHELSQGRSNPKPPQMTANLITLFQSLIF